MKTGEQQSDVREAKKRGQSVKTRIFIHQRGQLKPTKSDVREAKKRGQSVTTGY